MNATYNLVILDQSTIGTLMLALFSYESYKNFINRLDSINSIRIDSIPHQPKWPISLRYGREVQPPPAKIHLKLI